MSILHKTSYLKSLLQTMLDIQMILSLVPTCPKNRKNRGFLPFSDVWDSYDQWEHRIPDIPDGQ